MRPNASIFQLIISSDVTPLDGASPILTDNAESFRRLHPDHDYHLLNGQDVESILASNFSSDVQRSYAVLRPNAYKADLARYCLLLHYGGIYADLSMRLLNPLSLPTGKVMACFRDAPFAGRGLWWVSNGLIRAPAGREELRVAVEMIVANCQSHYYGATAVHPTGPALFGRALASVDREEDIEVGVFRNFSNSMNPHSYGYLNGDGQLIAVRMKARHLADLGVRGTNHYPELWESRNVYLDGTLRFDHLSNAIKLSYNNRTDDGITFNEAMGNFITFGPYVTLEAGHYRAWFDVEITTGADQVTIDVYVPGDEIVVAAQFDTLSKNLLVDFCLSKRTEGVEVRLSTRFGASGRITALNIKGVALSI